MRTKFCFLLLIAVFSVMSFPLAAQDASDELAATLEVLYAGVEVLRANTVNWITVKVEAIVGVGDTIRTDATGRTRITFFADGTDTELLPNTEYRIVRFEGDDQSFNISVEVVVGQTTQRLGRLLDVSSSYDVRTPGMTLAARGTEFAIRVEEAGRAAMLVSKGDVNVSKEAAAADVPPGFGIRTEVEGNLSDVVEATTFEGLDAALDGCTATLTTTDDVRLNVRTGPGLNFPRSGTVDATEIANVMGVSQTGGWYRIAFRGGFGWILSSSAQIDKGCAGLRIFADDYGPEDTSLYSSVGDPITIEELNGSGAIEATPEATVAPA